MAPDDRLSETSPITALIRAKDFLDAAVVCLKRVEGNVSADVRIEVAHHARRIDALLSQRMSR